MEPDHSAGEGGQELWPLRGPERENSEREAWPRGRQEAQQAQRIAQRRLPTEASLSGRAWEAGRPSKPRGLASVVLLCVSG